MYYILKKHYYYDGAQSVPKDGPITDAWDDIIEFDSSEDAKEFILWDCGTNLLCIGENRYQSTGIYDLREGEYDRPDYQIRRRRETKKKTLQKKIIDELIDMLEYVIDDGYYYEGADQLLSALKEVSNES
tara:strand:+ start:675 stop:1064 length:390 start_codon:yes stop_codon:yes gene_type:complete